jgi:large subunit ribosomal protein L15
MAKRITNRATRANAAGGERKKKTHQPDHSSHVSVPSNSRSSRKRIGRGPGSGMGKTSTRGQKGQRARAANMKPGFEGGQMRLVLRMPKRGFTNIFKEVFQPVNLTILAKAGLTGEVTPELLAEKGIIQDSSRKIKILGTGEITVGLTITADAVSKSAEEKIQKAGGKIIIRQTKEQVEAK